MKIDALGGLWAAGKSANMISFIPLTIKVVAAFSARFNVH